MFNSELIKDYLLSLGASVAPENILNAVEEGNKLSSLTPSERLKLIAERLDLRNVTIGQTAVDRAPEHAFPGLAFMDLRWVMVAPTAEGGFRAQCYETGSEFDIPVEKHPVTVLMWLKFDTAEELSEQSTEKSSVSVKSVITDIIKHNPKWILNVCIATLLVNIFAVITSLFAMQVYDRVVPTLAMSTLYSLVTGVFIIYALDFTLKNARSRIVDHNASAIDKRLASYVFDHLLNAEIDKLPRQLGTLTAQLTSVDSIRQFFTSSIVFTLIDMPFAILFLGVIYLVGGPIAAVYVSFLVLSLAIGFIAQRASAKANKELMSRSNEKMGILVDAIKGTETIRSTAAGSKFSREWQDVCADVSRSSLAQKKINTLATTLSGSLGQVSYAIAIVIGVSLIGEGDITMGAMIACSILGGRVLGPVGQAVGYLIQYEGVRQSISLVDQFLQIPKARDNRSNLIFPPSKPRVVSLEGVQFAYQEAKVNQIEIDNLQLTAGDRIALLGGIGSGKSTLLKIMAGLIKPTSGRVRADGVDLWELDPFFVAKNVSYLPQSPDLFKGTLKDNIALGSSGIDSRIADVANLLQLEPIYANNDKGIDMEIAEGGTGLSGGQRQMVGLARVFINAPTIWLLDEPTASLDSNTQSTVVSAIKSRVKPNDILVFATHNLKFAREMSTRIIVMDKGKVQRDVPTENVEVRRVER
jgi:ATP-binding cassette subfamily C protein LapB